MWSERCKTKFRIILKGHILNPLWLSKMERRHIRGAVTSEEAGRYLNSYDDFIRNFVPVQQSEDDTGCEERIFSIWLQGEEKAPKIVKACWNSIRRNCKLKLTVLDEKSVLEWVSLPDYIIQKWRKGSIRPAHFADICRLALLVKYGGVWMDATVFLPAPLPGWIMDEDFFLFMSGETQRGWHSYVQNCFIRARKGNFLASAWLALLLEYWRREDKPIDYFVHQLLFKKLVEKNDRAAREFASMPKILQDPTHELWFLHGDADFNPESWAKMTAGVAFQKTEYKSEMAANPRPGSNAAYIMKTYDE